MATLRQKEAAKLIVENVKLKKPLSAGKLLEKVGYGKIRQDPSRILKSIGVQEELKTWGFDEESAKKVVSELMHSPKVDPSARLKATDQVFKVHGSYAPEKKDVRKVVINIHSEIKEKAESIIDGFLNG